MAKTPYIPRLKVPTYNKKAYITVEYGGLNHAILGNKDYRKYNGSVLPNCTGYVHGRVIELIGDDSMLCVGNAENYWNYRQDGFKRGQTPQVGAIACWRKGEAGKSKDGAGHVAFVENVNSKGDIYTSDSGWTGNDKNGRYFRTRWLKRVNGSYALGPDYWFQGFIYIYDPTTIKTIKNGVYRLYDPVYKNHMFTLNHGEANSLLRGGWTYEGVEWKAPSTVKDEKPIGENVYRMYNPNNGDHVFTAKVKEKEFLQKNGWKYEGIAFRSSASKAIAVYRLFSDDRNVHMYTSDYDEKQALIATGWIDEGVAFYGMKP